MTGTIYAISDIHGCANELDALLARLSLEDSDHIVFMGDYIDRGPASARVIDRLRRLRGAVLLRGNHEQLMIDAHRAGPDSTAWSIWVANGGAETLESFGGSIPADVLEWADTLPYQWHTGDLFFVHAGIDPERHLEDQEPNVMLWIRDRFLRSEAAFGARIVHGHTPGFGAIELRGNRINLDAGCCYGGELVCGIFTQSAEPRFISASGKPVAIH